MDEFEKKDEIKNNRSVEHEGNEVQTETSSQPFAQGPESNPYQSSETPEGIWQAPGYYGQAPEGQEASDPQAQPSGTPSPWNTPSPTPPTGPVQEPRYQSAWNPGAAPQPSSADGWVYMPGQGTHPETEYRDQKRLHGAHRGRIWPAILLTAVCCLLVGCLVGVAVLPILQGDRDPGALIGVTSTPKTTAAPSDTAAAESSNSAVLDPNFTLATDQNVLEYVTSGSLADMAEAMVPSIVGVLNKVYVTPSSNGNAYNAPNNPNAGTPNLVEYSSGSGVIISSDGYIVTNYHVVEDADALTILMDDGEEIEATLVGYDAVTDLAVVKIDRTDLPAARLGNSDAVRVGELAVAIGNPLGSDLAGTVTMGIISAVNRTIQVEDQLIEVLQTDAAINPGNSGGALVNTMGQVIGICSAKAVVAGYDESGNAISAEGIGYAIPINNAKPIIEQLIQTGSVPRPALGITVQLATYSKDANVKGLIISSITENGPVDKAGLEVGDVILSMNDEAIESLTTFKHQLMSYAVGDTVTLEIDRNDNKFTVEVTLMDSNILNSQEQEPTSPEWTIPGYGNSQGNDKANPWG